MNRISITVLAGFLLILACRKNELSVTNLSTTSIKAMLRDSMPAPAFERLDWSSLQVSAMAGKRRIALIGLQNSTRMQETVVLQLAENGQLEKGFVVRPSGAPQVSKDHPAFQGQLAIDWLNGTPKLLSAIVNGFISSSHQLQQTVNSVRLNSECSDCTIPEVIVGTSYNTNNIDWSALLSLYWLFGDWPPMDYIQIAGSNPNTGGGGGGPVVIVDLERPETKSAIDAKKYTDCFHTVSDNLATYSLTISADLPVDGHPETFFDPTIGSPGHAFIELSKSNPYGSVKQNIGFYPASSWTVMTGHDVNGKLADDGDHEYNARYTITVNAAAFQAALDKVGALASQPYNVSYFNCVDFALLVFNAAGGNLSIPQNAIPGFGVPGGSSTPQGLFTKIQQLKNSGTTGASTTNNKEYVGDSHGPCN